MLASMSEGARDTPALNWSDLGVSELLPTGTVTLLLADVEVFRRGILGGLQRVLSARAADDYRQMVGRAGSGPQRANLLFQERSHPGRTQYGLDLALSGR
jgi:hypothetical protein